MGMTHRLRGCAREVREAMGEAPIVLVAGPRQAGKSALVAEIGRSSLNARPVTLEELSACVAAAHDPEGYLRRLPRPAILDEVQAAPALWSPLKHAEGPLLLTSSVDPHALPALAGALAGRARVCTLYPFSVGETVGVQEGFVKALFAATTSWPREALDRRPWDTAMANATFPALAATEPSGRTAWCEGYLTTLLQHDARRLTAVEKPEVLATLLAGLASHVGTLLNDAALAREAGLNAVTLRRYRALLSALFLILTILPWSHTRGARLVKAPKLYLTDTILLCHLLRVEPSTLVHQYPALLKGVLENFVASELTKQLARTEPLGTLTHLQRYDGRGVNFVIERPDGRLVAIAVNATATIGEADAATLRLLQTWVGPAFVRGVVLYLGTQTVRFDKSLAALPLSSLWTLGAVPLQREKS